jgi:Flp pilus assembly protein TadG
MFRKLKTRNLFTKIRPTRKRRRGAVAVEMAMTIPVLLLIVFASYEFARANMIRHTVESAAYEGARRGILPGATEKEVKDGANHVLGSIGTRGATMVVDLGLTNPTDQVEVTIRVPLKANMVFASFFLRDAVVERQCRMAREKAF